MKTQILTVGLIATVGATAAQASMNASALTDLNLRAGPTPNAQILSVIPDGDAVDVEGCLDASAWCKVSYDGNDGWAYGDYLTVPVEGEPHAIIPNREKVSVSTVTYENGDADGAAAVGTIGAIAGGVAAGPVGAAAGAVLGAGAGAAIDPDEETITYVQKHSVEPVYLDGEVVVGAALPDAVTLQTIPDAEYTYAYVNGVPVLVEPAERRVVYIVR